MAILPSRKNLFLNKSLPKSYTEQIRRPELAIVVQQMVSGKDHLRQKHIFISPGTGEPMPFVYGQQVPDRGALFFESRNHLIGAFIRHATVVLALNNKHGLFYFIAIIERGDF